MVRLSLSEMAAKVDSRKIGKKYQKIVEDVALELADALQRESPEGATGDLKKGWDIEITPPQGFGFATTIAVVNRSEASLYRIVGRGPGRMPPILKIQQWSDKVLGLDGFTNSRRIAYAIALSIAKRGTRRWRENRNFAGLNRDGTIQRGGLIDLYTKKLLRELRKGRK